MNPVSLFKRCIAELVGTYVLVFLGTGSVVTTVLLFQGWTPLPDNAFNIGISMPAWFAIGMAFAVAIIAMIYAFGHISGTHINPAVSIALWATKRFPTKDMGAYIVAQCIGAFLASVTIVLILGLRAAPNGATPTFQPALCGGGSPMARSPPALTIARSTPCCRNTSNASSAANPLAIPPKSNCIPSRSKRTARCSARNSRNL